MSTLSGVLPPPAGGLPPSRDRLRGILERLEPRLRSWVHTGETLRRPAISPAPWSARAPGWRALLEGDLPLRSLIELVGRPGQGRFGLVLELLAAATRSEENAALVDLGDALDPDLAAAAGVRLERLLWIRPQRLGQALATTEITLHTGFPCVVLDLGLPPLQGGRGTAAQWLRLARVAQAHPVVLVVSSPFVVAGGAATCRIELGTARAQWSARGREIPLLEVLSPRKRRTARTLSRPPRAAVG